MEKEKRSVKRLVKSMVTNLEKTMGSVTATGSG